MNSPLIHSIVDQFSPEALGELQLWLGQNPPTIPISQITGFSQFTVKNAPFITTAETTASATYVDLATVGPTVTGLSNGAYLIMFGAVANNSGAGNRTFMSLSVNGSTPSDNDSCEVTSATHESTMMAVAKTLSGNNNTLTAQYRAAAGTGNFLNRWLLALRYANA